MKTAGIIAEYNPFHNGHQFHIEETRRRTGADFVIAVISGDFVQRGAPSVLDKYLRAQTALRHGADLVLELPVVTATSSAEGFATGGIALLAALGVVDTVSCGCESAHADPALFARVVTLLADEPEEYKKALSDALKSGHHYPSAREAAGRTCLLDKESRDPDRGPACSNKNAVSADGGTASADDLGRLLSGPNNILALEYARAIRKAGCAMDLCLIPRQGGASRNESALAERGVPYNGPALPEKDAPCGRTSLPGEDASYASARAIRGILLEDPSAALSPEQDALLGATVPPDAYEELLRERTGRCLLCENDFSNLLHYALTGSRERLSDFGPDNQDLIRRITHHLEQFTDWTAFAELIKTKNQTYTAVSRLLTQILLGIRREDLALASQYQGAPYARVLGFCREADPLVKEIRARSSIPVLARPAKDRETLGEDAQRLLQIDLTAHEVYAQVLHTKCGCRIQSELRRPLLRI